MHRRCIISDGGLYQRVTAIESAALIIDALVRMMTPRLFDSIGSVSVVSIVYSTGLPLVQRDVAILDEPEHLTWFEGAPRL